MPTLLMTRPQEAAERFVATLPQPLRARLSPVFSPLVAIEPATGPVALDDARGLIFTSANGVAIAARLIRRRDLACYCVGRATTRAAQQAGWQARCAGGNAEALIRFVHESAPTGPLLHLRGTHGRGNVVARLNALGHPAREQVIYDQPLLAFTDRARQALDGPGPVIAPLFSPRTARQFANLVTGTAPLYLAALSDAVAEPVKALNYKTLLTSPDPSADAMARLVGQLTKAAGRVEGPRPAQ